MKIFLDIDEVLAKFCEKACQAHGLTLAEMRETFGEWWDGPTFWAEINRVERRFGFWENIDLTPWAYDVLEACEEAVGVKNVYLLTSPHDVASHHGKLKWLERHLPNVAHGHRFVITKEKHLLAAKGRLLIDDHETNCKAFCDAGGQAMLFPHWRNEQTTQWIPDPAAYVALGLARWSVGAEPCL